MMRHTLLLLVFFSFVSCLSGEEQFLLDETFSADTIPKPWQPAGRKGAFSIVGGTLRCVAAEGDDHGPSIGVPIDGHDFVLEFDFQFVKPGYFLCLIDGDSQFAGQAHLLRFAATKQQVALMQDRGDPASKKAQKEQRDRNGGKRMPPTQAQLQDPTFYRIERLANKLTNATDGKQHHVTIEVRGNQVTAKYDDLELSGTATVLDVKKSRLVFLVAQTGDVRIDNVKLRTLSNKRSGTND